MTPAHDILPSLLLPESVRHARLVRFLFHPITRYVLAWLLALGLAAAYLDWAWHYFDNPRRGDGNNGHVFIDFGGQWLLGRMVVEGHGRQLYHRGLQRDVLRRAYPREAEIPPEDREPSEKGKHDADDLMTSFMDANDARALASTLVPLAGAGPLEAAALAAVGTRHWDADRLQAAVRLRGGPLYPPVLAMLFAPVSCMPPQAAYRFMQVANIVFAFVAGLGVAGLLRGRVWWPIAAAGVIVYPGFPGTVCLGQNAPITLAILVWGWALAARGRPEWGGVVWGLFAFKPVWALAFFLVPLLTGRWRMCLGMVSMGVTLVGLTLPVVGVQGWLDWLHVGQLANQLYNTDLHWIFLSRDVYSIPRRWLLDFGDVGNVKDRPAATVSGWALLLIALAVTVGVVLRRRAQARAPTGPPAAFLFLGAWLCCYHFMYYDVLLTALPVFLLFDEPRRFLTPRALVTVPLGPTPVGLDPRSLWLVNSGVLTLLGLLAATEYVLPHLGLEVFVWAAPLAGPDAVLPLPLEFTTNLMGTPWNTLLLIVLWLWCARLWARESGAALPGSAGRAPASSPPAGPATSRAPGP